MAKRKPTAEEMLVRMAGLCAGAEQCAADIRSKIMRQGFTAEEAEKMVGYLERNKYLDDSRYARAYASDKVRFSGWGRMKVRVGLHGKGLSDTVISQALENIQESDYEEALRKAMASKVRSLNLGDVKDRQKLYRHLASRGFESHLIMAEMRRLMKSVKEGELE